MQQDGAAAPCNLPRCELAYAICGALYANSSNWSGCVFLYVILEKLHSCMYAHALSPLVLLKMCKARLAP